MALQEYEISQHEFAAVQMCYRLNEQPYHL